MNTQYLYLYVFCGLVVLVSRVESTWLLTQPCNDTTYGVYTNGACRDYFGDIGFGVCKIKRTLVTDAPMRLANIAF